MTDGDPQARVGGVLNVGRHHGGIGADSSRLHQLRLDGLGQGTATRDRSLAQKAPRAGLQVDRDHVLRRLAETTGAEMPCSRHP
jgi:hypothetical protein